MLARTIRLAAVLALAGGAVLAGTAVAQAEDTPGVPAPQVQMPQVPQVQMPPLPQVQAPAAPQVQMPATPQAPKAKSKKNRSNKAAAKNQVPAMPDYPAAPQVAVPATSQASASSDGRLRSPQELLASLQEAQAPQVPGPDQGLALPQAATQPQAQNGLPLGTIGAVAGVGAVAWLGSAALRRRREAAAPVAAAVS